MITPPLWWSESAGALYSADDGSDYWRFGIHLPTRLVDELPADAVELVPEGAP